jgi:Arf/Sar family protein
MGNLFDKLKNFFTSSKIEVCIVGLENSGKTTLLN